MLVNLAVIGCLVFMSKVNKINLEYLSFSKLEPFIFSFTAIRLSCIYLIPNSSSSTYEISKLLVFILLNTLNSINT